MKVIITTTFIWTDDVKKYWTYDLYFKSLRKLVNNSDIEFELILFDNTLYGKKVGRSYSFEDLVYDTYGFRDIATILYPEDKISGFHSDSFKHAYGVKRCFEEALKKKSDYILQTDFDIMFYPDKFCEFLKNVDTINKMMGRTIVTDLSAIRNPKFFTKDGSFKIQSIDDIKDKEGFLKISLPRVFPYLFLFPTSLLEEAMNFDFDTDWNLNKYISYLIDGETYIHDNEWDKEENRKIWLQLDGGVKLMVQLFNQHRDINKLLMSIREFPIEHIFHLSRKIIYKEEEEIKQEYKKLLTKINI